MIRIMTQKALHNWGNTSFLTQRVLQRAAFRTQP